MLSAWVIKDYTSEKLDLSSAESYREYVLQLLLCVALHSPRS